MKKLTSIILILFLSLLSSPSWGETLTMDDLVLRYGFYYKKYTETPFTGKVTGRWQGSIKDGKQEGLWIRYYDNGQLVYKGHFKKSKRIGEWFFYYDNGQLRSKGNYNKYGYVEGEWVKYWKDGTLKSTY